MILGKQLPAFCAVASTLSFTKAAEMLNVTQPSITQQIQSMEAAMGRKLFRRDTRTVSLTDAGVTVYAYADRIIQLEAAMCKAVAAGAEEGDKTVPELPLSRDVVATILHHVVDRVMS